MREGIHDACIDKLHVVVQFFVCLKSCALHGV